MDNDGRMPLEWAAVNEHSAGRAAAIIYPPHGHYLTSRTTNSGAALYFSVRNPL